MYSFQSKIRYSEVDKDCKLNLFGILNYFQDCSCFQSESLHKGVMDRDLVDYAWLLNSWQVIVHRYPSFAETITIGTWAYGFDSIYGYRNYVIKDEHDQIIACANSNWVYVDSKTCKLVRVTSENVDAFPIEPRYEGMEYAPRKITLPKESISYDPFPVMQTNIDSNHHVNNAQYINMATEYLPDDFKIKQMRAEYKRQATLGDMIYPNVTTCNDLCTIQLSTESGTPYCIIEFTRDSST